MGASFQIDSNDRHLSGLAPGDKVRVRAREGMFVVLRLHRNEGKADLLRCEKSPHPVDSGVPLSLIQLADDYLPELFRWYIESAPARHRPRRRLKTPKAG
ncbi:MAG TPA: hypothetical protein VGJ21_03345 [Terracidiphilus sp.]|jgi:hypothetical protein